MTDTPDLAAIKRRAEAATPGPWRDRPSVHGNRFRYVLIDKAEEYSTLELQPNDARFIAHAREDIPALLDALSAAEAKVRELEAALRPIIEMPVDNAELLRIRNKCECVEGDVKIWSRMLQTIVDAVRAARTAAAATQKAPTDDRA